MQFSFRPRVARQLALAASVLSAVSFLTSCNKGGDFTKTKSGMEYKIYKSVNGKYEPREIANGKTRLTRTAWARLWPPTLST